MIREFAGLSGAFSAILAIVTAASCVPAQGHRPEYKVISGPASTIGALVEVQLSKGWQPSKDAPPVCSDQGCVYTLWRRPPPLEEHTCTDTQSIASKR